MQFMLSKTLLCSSLLCLLLQNTTVLLTASAKKNASAPGAVIAHLPDMFFLKQLQAEVENQIKGFISSTTNSQVAINSDECCTKVQEIFQKKLDHLGKLTDELEKTGFDCLATFAAENRGLQNWLSSLDHYLGQLCSKICNVLKASYQAGQNSALWLARPLRLQRSVRSEFISFYQNLSDSWFTEIPELLHYQTNSSHAELLGTKGRGPMPLTELLLKLPSMQKMLDFILKDDFRDATSPTSIKKRAEFCSFISQTSQIMRAFEITQLIDISNEQYNALLHFAKTIGNALNDRIWQLHYDPQTFNIFVKQQAWLLFYWLYNVFPYKNYPWQDENMLTIEELFYQVSTTLNLKDPFVFQFNHNNRNKFKSPRGDHGTGQPQKNL